jgi:hypothetical protein
VRLNAELRAIGRACDRLVEEYRGARIGGREAARQRLRFENILQKACSQFFVMGSRAPRRRLAVKSGFPDATENLSIRLGVSRVREISVAFFFGNTFENRGDCSPKLLNSARLHFA